MEATTPLQLDYFRRVWQLRYFWYSLVANDLHTRYRHSLLGIGWSLARPLGMTLVFAFVFGKVFEIPMHEYVPYVLVGLTLWQFLVENAMTGCKSFHTGAAYIRQQSVPLIIFPLRTTLGAAFHTGVALLLGLSITWYFKGFGNLAALPSVLPCLVLFLVLGWSLAIICGLAQTHFPDTCFILELLFQVSFYLTPVILYPDRLRGYRRFAWIVDLNPFWSLLELVRQPILYGQPPPFYNVAISACFVAVLAVVACLCLRKLERNLVFWI